MSNSQMDDIKDQHVMQFPAHSFDSLTKISSIEKNRDQHIQNVVSLLYDTESPEIGKNGLVLSDLSMILANVKLSIAVYLRNFMREVIGMLGGDEISPGYLQNLMDIFY
jgi:hypothetical protein